MKAEFTGAIAAALLALLPAAGRGSEVSFAYQGCLLDDHGQVLANRNHSIEFRIYDQATEGGVLWSCSRSVVLSASGQFSVELSGNSASGETLGEIFAGNAGRSLYIALVVDGEGAEISPRQKLLSVPRAIWAADSVGASGDMNVSSNVVVSSASNTGTTAAESIVVSNEMRCDGRLMAGSMSAQNASVAGSITGMGAIPVGGIIVWSGSAASIPDGWALCDGNVSNGWKTPNLLNSFILGVGGKYGLGDRGGSETVTLKSEHMPRHRHEYKFKGADTSMDWDSDNIFYDLTGHYPKNSNSKYTEYAGGDKPHDNMPPYYALCYIMRVK